MTIEFDDTTVVIKFNNKNIRIIRIIRIWIWMPVIIIYRHYFRSIEDSCFDLNIEKYNCFSLLNRRFYRSLISFISHSMNLNDELEYK